MWVTHFPPRFKAPPNEYLTLLDDELLVDAAHACGVPIIFSGHMHLQRNYRLDEQGYQDSPRVFCAGSAACTETNCDTTFQSVDLEVDGGVVSIGEQIDVTWNRQDNEFEPRILLDDAASLEVT